MQRRMVNAFVIWQLDYCNDIYANPSVFHLGCPQSAFNAEARHFIGPHGLSTSIHFSETVFTGWDVENACNSNCVFPLYKAVNGMTPDDIKEIRVSAPVTKRRATLRSAVSNIDRLIPTSGSTKTKFGYCTFRTAGPTAWNSLPVSVRQSASLESFKRQ